MSSKINKPTCEVIFMIKQSSKYLLMSGVLFLFDVPSSRSYLLSSFSGHSNSKWGSSEGILVIIVITIMKMDEMSGKGPK